ncbi:MAG: hypothetical protein ACRBI6_14465 [Acidimicrobiales bacterium]
MRTLLLAGALVVGAFIGFVVVQLVVLVVFNLFVEPDPEGEAGALIAALLVLLPIGTIAGGVGGVVAARRRWPRSLDRAS